MGSADEFRGDFVNSLTRGGDRYMEEIDKELSTPPRQSPQLIAGWNPAASTLRGAVWRGGFSPAINYTRNESVARHADGVYEHDDDHRPLELPGGTSRSEFEISDSQSDVNPLCRRVAFLITPVGVDDPAYSQWEWDREMDVGGVDIGDFFAWKAICTAQRARRSRINRTSCEKAQIDNRYRDSRNRAWISSTG